MKKTFRVAGKEIVIKENLVDKAVNYFAPVKGSKRLYARAQRATFEALSGGYRGASKSPRSLSEFNPRGNDADSDILPDLPTLRNRCRDLTRNIPLAGGAINTVCTNVVGTGLKFKSLIDRDVLNMSEDAADAWESNTEREFRLWAESKECDVERKQNFAGIQNLVFRSTLENGDVFALLPFLKRQGSPYGTKIQLIEADRVCNKDNQRDTDEMAGGVKIKKETGEPLAYYVAKQHPGNTLYTKIREWDEVPAFTRSGAINVIHLFKHIRIGQKRGVPYLAPVIEALKQLGRYTEVELMAAVISGCLTVFVKTENGDGEISPMAPTSEVGGKTSDEDYKLAPGAVIGLAPGEDVSTVNPGRPNALFDPFVTSILRQIGVALEIPYEVLVKNFMASYSAARAALLEAWKFFSERRQWIADNFCQLVYERWMDEAVALGRISAPGYFDDPIIRKAYLGSQWVGPAKGMINENDEVSAANERINMGMSTLAEETAALTGTDWEKKTNQIRKERQILKEIGLIQEKVEKSNAMNNQGMDEEMPDNMPKKKEGRRM